MSASASAQIAEPSARDRSEAADAYDRGVAAFLSENYAAAAHWFEAANRLAPSPAALMQAIRANDRAGNDLRTASLSLRMADKYPGEDQAINAVRSTLDAAERRYFLVAVECSETCTIEVNGAIEEHERFFVEPGRRVTVTAEFPGGRLSEETGGEAGAMQTLSFNAPPPPPAGPDRTVAQGGRVDEESGGVPKWVFFTALGATAAAGGVTVWSGVDTLAGVDAYENNPTQERLDAGERKELRTNIFIGATAGLAAVTALVGIFTDWKGDDEDSRQGVTPTVGLSRGGVMMGLEGSF